MYFAINHLAALTAVSTVLDIIAFTVSLECLMFTQHCSIDSITTYKGYSKTNKIKWLIEYSRKPYLIKILSSLSLLYNLDSLLP